MLRGLLLGGLAFAAVFTAERQFSSVEGDIRRYNAMRAMSGDPPLSRQLLGLLGTQLKALQKAKRPAVMEFVSALQSDIIRYMRISTM
jgi:hypothetical protein